MPTKLRYAPQTTTGGVCVQTSHLVAKVSNEFSEDVAKVVPKKSCRRIDELAAIARAKKPEEMRDFPEPQD